ncbi:MAG: TetR/AcrR family transcriptional regulator [Promethearchaeota archaeon]
MKNYKIREKNKEDLSKKERKILRTKNIILDAAKELFSKKSFDMNTMDDIADSAALSRATLYNYFDTKEEIYLNIGLLKIKEWIKRFKHVDSAKFSGEHKILFLTENLVKDLLEFPIYINLLRRFFDRSKELNIPIENIFYTNLIEKKNFQFKSVSGTQYKIYYDLLKQYIKYRQIWLDAIELGKKDGSIKSPKNIHHLNFIIIMTLFGLLDQIELRRSLISRVDITTEMITKFVLQFVRKFLNGEI